MMKEVQDMKEKNQEKPPQKRLRSAAKKRRN